MKRQAASLKTYLDGVRGATSQPLPTSRSADPNVLLYKIMGKMFAILSLAGDGFVILKLEPFLLEIVRDQYKSVAHRSHLDKRYWISIDFGGDVPVKEVKRLIMHSYGLVSAKLTRQQRAELAAC